MKLRARLLARKRLAVTTCWLCLFILSGCAAVSYYDQGKPQRLESSDAQTVDSINALQPQVEQPLAIAIIPPSRVYLSDAFSLEEEEAVKSWVSDLTSQGIIETAQFVPKSLLPQCNSSDSTCFLEQSRTAAARLHADTLLFLQDNSRITRDANSWAVFDITLIGLLVAPGHKYSVDTQYEATLIDVSTGYLLASASARSSVSKTLPYAWLKRQQMKQQARLDAIGKLGDELTNQLKQLD